MVGRHGLDVDRLDTRDFIARSIHRPHAEGGGAIAQQGIVGIGQRIAPNACGDGDLLLIGTTEFEEDLAFVGSALHRDPAAAVGHREGDGRIAGRTSTYGNASRERRRHDVLGHILGEGVGATACIADRDRHRGA